MVPLHSSGIPRFGSDAGVDVSLEVRADRLVRGVFRHVELPGAIGVHRDLHARALPRSRRGRRLLRRRGLLGLREDGTGSGDEERGEQERDARAE